MWSTRWRPAFRRGTWFALVVAGALVAPGCGGDTSAGGAGAAGAAGAVGTAGTAGTGASGSAGTDAGAAPFPCGTAKPLLGAATGFEQCSRGYVRRVAPGTCPSLLPRPDAVPGYYAPLDTCEYDSDCTAPGPYAHCGQREGGSAHACVAGCVSDADCPAGRICLCGDAIGRCVPATCASAADCAPGFDCASYNAQPGCFSASFACQTPTDACGGDADCAGSSVNVSFCVAEGGARICSTAQCTTP